jgi:hypothetical protein
MSVTPNLTFASINANSLNVASANKPVQIKKLHGILKLKTDIIFISDIRLSTRNPNGSSDILRIFLNNPFKSYTAILNSTMNKRGVAILINNDLDFLELN